METLPLNGRSGHAQYFDAECDEGNTYSGCPACGSLLMATRQGTENVSRFDESVTITRWQYDCSAYGCEWWDAI